MKIVPFGKAEEYVDAVAQSGFESETMNLESQPEQQAPAAGKQVAAEGDRDAKVQKMEAAIAEILGDPNLDNLMVVLTAIGMSKISLSMAEDNSHLSVAGIIDLSEEDNKIKKE